jgi:hypothetical protein
VALLFLSYAGFSQSYEGSVEYMKKDQKAVIMEFPFAPSIVEDAIVQKMEKMGHKKKESKGFLVYRNVVLADISSEPADYMIKVERKSRKEKDESVVYILMNRGEENIIERADALVNSNVKTFLHKLSPEVESYNLDLEIKAQEKQVEKAQKKFNDLVENKSKMEKKIKELQDDLEENAKEQEDQQKIIETQQEILEAMKKKRS